MAVAKCDSHFCMVFIFSTFCSLTANTKEVSVYYIIFYILVYVNAGVDTVLCPSLELSFHFRHAVASAKECGGKRDERGTMNEDSADTAVAMMLSCKHNFSFLYKGTCPFFIIFCLQRFYYSFFKYILK